MTVLRDEYDVFEGHHAVICCSTVVLVSWIGCADLAVYRMPELAPVLLRRLKNCDNENPMWSVYPPK